MKEEKLYQQLLEEKLAVDIEAAWEEKGKFLTRHMLRKKPRLTMSRLSVAFASILLILVLGVSAILLWPGPDEPDEPDEPPIFYAGDDLQSVVIIDINDLKGIYNRNLEIESFDFEKGYLYQTIDAPIINAYIELNYLRHVDENDEYGVLWEKDAINITVVLIENVEYNQNEYYNDEWLDRKTNYIVEGKNYEIKYHQQNEDIIEGIIQETQVRAKFTVDKFAYYISIKHTAFTEEAGDILITILNQLF